MHGRRRGRRGAAALAAAAVVGVVGVGGALPAQAAQGFSLDTPQRGIGDGSTHARGSLTFTSARAFTISSTVWDSCPGDSRGAYLTYRVVFTDGSTIGAYSKDAFNADVDGCDNGRISKTVTRTYEKRVRTVELWLFESDGVDRGAYQWDRSTVKDNPRT